MRTREVNRSLEFLSPLGVTLTIFDPRQPVDQRKRDDGDCAKQYPPNCVHNRPSASATERQWPRQLSYSPHSVPRRACSRSIASNSALKLPLPKLFDPCRWMISKNSVGRSATGFVKIWSM